MTRFDPQGPLRGPLRPPADKSISHRAALIAAMSEGETLIEGYLDAADTRSTLDAVAALGAGVERLGPEPGAPLRIRGVGLRGPAPAAIDAGNAGTLLRLLPGWLAGQDGGEWTLDGDDSIRRRPVDRVAAPLRRMGAELSCREERLPPLRIRGVPLRGIEYELPVASAQVKSCLLFAGLLAEGETRIVEPLPTRDHSERLLAAAGAEVGRDGDTVVIQPAARLEVERIVVPADLSSAAFFVVAALLVPGSEVMVEGVGLNPTRVGLLSILERMGAEIEAIPIGERGGEPIGDLRVVASELRGTEVGAAEVPLAIDELPLVALAACFAEGTTTIRDAAELRRKESDRIETVTAALSARRHDRLPRRPSHRHARRRRRPRFQGRRRGGGDGRGRRQLPRLRGRPRRPAQRRRLTRRAPPPARLYAAPLMVIAIDGPAGAGKSTVARAVAAELGFTYLDSGAMYRCVALDALERGAGLDDGEALGALARELEIRLEGDRVLLGDRDVGAQIREPGVTAAASRVSVHPRVREAMVDRQRRLIALGDFVAEGRDIGTVVSPEAPLKVFLTASDAERARRRAAQTGEDFESVLDAQRRRDARDTEREHGALRAAEDAVELDTTGLGLEEVVGRVVALARERGLA
jgi:3-phosphoshikimate 1-carboxyvinyltransferase